jgi:hypothetical protein
MRFAMDASFCGLGVKVVSECHARCGHSVKGENKGRRGRTAAVYRVGWIVDSNCGAISNQQLFMIF